MACPPEGSDAADPAAGFDGSGYLLGITLEGEEVVDADIIDSSLVPLPAADRAATTAKGSGLSGSMKDRARSKRDKIFISWTADGDALSGSLAAMPGAGALNAYAPKRSASRASYSSLTTPFCSSHSRRQSNAGASERRHSNGSSSQNLLAQSSRAPSQPLLTADRSDRSERAGAVRNASDGAFAPSHGALLAEDLETPPSRTLEGSTSHLGSTHGGGGAYVVASAAISGPSEATPEDGETAASRASNQAMPAPPVTLDCGSLYVQQRIPAGTSRRQSALASSAAAATGSGSPSLAPAATPGGGGGSAPGSPVGFGGSRYTPIDLEEEFGKFAPPAGPGGGGGASGEGADDGECGCSAETISRDARGFDYSRYHAHALFHECCECGRRPATFLCLHDLKAVCSSHVSTHTTKDDYSLHHCPLYINILDIASCYDRIFWCERCRRFTWKHTDEYEPFTDQIAATRGTYLDEAVVDVWMTPYTVAFNAAATRARRRESLTAGALISPRLEASTNPNGGSGGPGLGLPGPQTSFLVEGWDGGGGAEPPLVAGIGATPPRPARHPSETAMGGAVSLSGVDISVTGAGGSHRPSGVAPASATVAAAIAAASAEIAAESAAAAAAAAAAPPPPPTVLRAVGASMQGWRSGQEDAEAVFTVLCPATARGALDRSCAVFCVFDGHGGDAVAKLAAQHIERFVSDAFASAPPPMQDLAAQGGAAEAVFSSASHDAAVIAAHYTGVFEDAFLALDEYLLETPEGARGDFNYVGCTACVVAISDDFVVCANLGDSGAALFHPADSKRRRVCDAVGAGAAAGGASAGGANAAAAAAAAAAAQAAMRVRRGSANMARAPAAAGAGGGNGGDLTLGGTSPPQAGLGLPAPPLPLGGLSAFPAPVFGSPASPASPASPSEVRGGHIPHPASLRSVGASASAASLLGTQPATIAVVPLSTAHRLSDTAEAARVLAAGYNISDGRIEGMLAVPRAFGDFDFKQNGAKDRKSQAVTPLPDVVVLPRKRRGRRFEDAGEVEEEKDWCVVVACDGIWDTIPGDDVCRIVHRHMYGAAAAAAAAAASPHHGTLAGGGTSSAVATPLTLSIVGPSWSSGGQTASGATGGPSAGLPRNGTGTAMRTAPPAEFDALAVDAINAVMNRCLAAEINDDGIGMDNMSMIVIRPAARPVGLGVGGGGTMPPVSGLSFGEGVAPGVFRFPLPPMLL